MIPFLRSCVMVKKEAIGYGLYFHKWPNLVNINQVQKYNFYYAMLMEKIDFVDHDVRRVLKVLEIICQIFIRFSL